MYSLPLAVNDNRGLPQVQSDPVSHLEVMRPSDEVITRALQLIRLVSEPTRLRLLYALTLDEVCVGDLAVISKVHQSTISNQLSYLRAQGMVTSRSAGRKTYYRIVDEQLVVLIKDLMKHAGAS